jgi:hypothetical protein
MDIHKTRKRHIWLMSKTIDILGHILKHVTQEQAQTLRDGIEGWTVLEVVCHLRDFDGFFYGRAQQMLTETNPRLPAYDHEKLAIEQQYNAQDLAYVYDELVLSRRRVIAFFESLTDEQWDCVGVHPERGHFTMTDAVMQFGMHDVDHLEQITRILEQVVTDHMLPTEAHLSQPGDTEAGSGS